MTFTKENGTFHRSFDEAFASSAVALYHYRKPILGCAKWHRLAYNEIQSAKLVKAPPPWLLVLGLLAVSLAFMGSMALAWSENSWAWPVAALPLYFPYLAYKSGQGRLRLEILLHSGHYRISAPLDGYKEEALHDNAILREIYGFIPGTSTPTADA